MTMKYLQRFHLRIQQYLLQYSNSNCTCQWIKEFLNHPYSRFISRKVRKIRIPTFSKTAEGKVSFNLVKVKFFRANAKEKGEQILIVCLARDPDELRIIGLYLYTLGNFTLIQLLTRRNWKMSHLTVCSKCVSTYVSIYVPISSFINTLQPFLLSYLNATMGLTSPQPSSVPKFRVTYYLYHAQTAKLI